MIEKALSNLAGIDPVRSPAPEPPMPSDDFVAVRSNGLADTLTNFMTNPLDTDYEQAFAGALLDAQFEAMVDVVKAGRVGKSDVHSIMHMNLAVTTYMADGKQYIPVFTDGQVMAQFLHKEMPDVHMRQFAFTTGELMDEVEKLGIAGILINPGRESFPLSAAYWNYISQVMPVVAVPDAEALQIAPLGPDKQMIVRTVVKRAKRTRGITSVWVANVQMKPDTDPVVAIIVNFRGNANQFEHKYAAEFARAVMPMLNYNQDVVVATTMDDMGQAVLNALAPVFEANTRWGRGAQYD